MLSTLTHLYRERPAHNEQLFSFYLAGSAFFPGSSLGVAPFGFIDQTSRTHSESFRFAHDHISVRGRWSTPDVIFQVFGMLETNATLTMKGRLPSLLKHLQVSSQPGKASRAETLRFFNRRASWMVHLAFMGVLAADSARDQSRFAWKDWFLGLKCNAPTSNDACLQTRFSGMIVRCMAALS